ncbi:MAG: nitroreductase family protein [Candidatus Adiutrix sp.]|jgi:nitroreductase|nr:nitroreductase family protein [Candidatus Adiutrix sp.]
MNETLRIISRRRSTKNFLPDLPDEAAVRAVVEAGRSAPSAMGRQARLFVVVQNRHLLEELNVAVKEVAADREEEFYRRIGNLKDYNVFYGAPVLVIVAGDRHKPMIEADCAAANQNMLIAAESLDLGACWINFTLFAFYGPRAEEIRRKLSIPSDYNIYCSVAVGRKAIDRLEKKTVSGNEVRFFE